MGTEDIIKLEQHHIAAAVVLSAAAGWNQTAADWQLMLTVGQAIGIEDDSGALLATTVSLIHGRRFGWISMVLVAAGRRGRGLASRLMSRAIGRLENDGLVPVVDATPQGEAVYRRLGFSPGLRYQRWTHDAVEEISPANQTGVVVDRTILDGVSSLDKEIFGGDRGDVIENLVARSAAFSGQGTLMHGFVLGREGRFATQIGPVSAQNPQTALALLDHALARLEGRVFIDACDHQTTFCGRLTDYGFKPQRPFLRMMKGGPAGFGRPNDMYAMAGPELG